MNVLVAGLGGIGQRHVRNLRALLGDAVQFSAYRVRGLGRVVTEQLAIEPGADVEDRYDIRVFTNLDEALAASPDVVFVCNPSSLHLPLALAAAKAGCHLFIEKPLAPTFDGVDELIAAVEQRHLVTLVGYQMRFHPCLRRLRALLADGAIGRLLAVRLEVGDYLPAWHRYEDYRDLYAARADQGGGVIISQIHEFDYLYSLFGLPQQVLTVGGRLGRLDIDVEDTAVTLMDYRHQDRVLPVVVHQDYLQRPSSRTCHVIGDEGKILADFLAPALQLTTAAGEEYRETFEGFARNQLFLDEMAHLLACLRGEDRPVVSVRDAAQSLRMALAAKASMETGRAVTLS